MIKNVAEIIRKTMGWCPQKDDDFFQAQTKGSASSQFLIVNPALKSSGLIEQIDVPLYMLDWRMLAILLTMFFSFFWISFTDYLDRTPISYLGTMLIMAALILFFLLSDRYRVSINSEKLLIKTPFLPSIKIPKNQIKNVKNIDNIIYKQKHSWVNIVLILSILFISLMQIILLYQQIARSIALEDAVMSIARTIFFISLFIIMFYRHSRLSYYPRAIQIDTGNKSITLCPRNEFEFDAFKEALER